MKVTSNNPPPVDDLINIEGLSIEVAKAIRSVLGKHYGHGDTVNDDISLLHGLLSTEVGMIEGRDDIVWDGAKYRIGNWTVRKK